MQGLNIDELREVLSLTPRCKLQNRMEIRSPGVGIADLGGKELQKALGGRRRGGEEGRDARQGRSVPGSPGEREGIHRVRGLRIHCVDNCTYKW